MNNHNIVFLDRESVIANVRRPAFSHSWTEYAATAAADAAGRLAGATIAITNKVPLRADTLAQLPDLKMIAVAATGTDIIDLAACKERGIVVSNIRNYAYATLPEHTFAMILALRRNLLAYRADVQAGKWQKSDKFCLFDYPITDLAGSKLGLLGYGALGQAVARLGRAFGMEILVHKRTPVDEEGVKNVSWDELLETSDVLSLHAPLNARADDARQAKLASEGFVSPTAREQAALALRVAERGLDEDKHGLIRRADLALIAAKRTHREVRVYSADMGLTAGIDLPPDDHHSRILASALARAVDAKDSYTRSHCQTVSQRCGLIGAQLGLDAGRLTRLRLAGLLHDVGKIGIPDSVLLKPAALDDDERRIVEAHPQIGDKLLEPLELLAVRLVARVLAPGDLRRFGRLERRELRAPVVSVNTKKKELVGEFHNGGREYQPQGSPVRVNVHDFPDKELGKAIPYGIYDVAANTGWVSVGELEMTLSTSAVAVCCSSASLVSLNRRTFSIAIAAWSARLPRSCTSLGGKSCGAVNSPRSTPRASPRRSMGTARHARGGPAEIISRAATV